MEHLDLLVRPVIHNSCFFGCPSRRSLQAQVNGKILDVPCKKRKPCTILLLEQEGKWPFPFENGARAALLKVFMVRDKFSNFSMLCRLPLLLEYSKTVTPRSSCYQRSFSVLPLNICVPAGWRRRVHGVMLVSRTHFNSAEIGVSGKNQ